MATVLLTPAAQEDLNQLPAAIHARIHAVLARLAAWPEVSGAKPLRNDLAGHWRIRTGDYRVQFHVRGENVIVEKIGNRRGFYDE